MSACFAIVGRPNVGKSTLFNRLVGKKIALVDNQPGVTRDFRDADARIGDARIVLLDTAGLERQPEGELALEIRRMTERALVQADACIFLIDAKNGVFPLDREVADFLRIQAKPIILVANKLEGRAPASGLTEAFELGLGAPIGLSAEHGEGVGDLCRAILDVVESLGSSNVGSCAGHDKIPNCHEHEDLYPDDANKPVRIAVVGRPNAGKSSLINSIIGQERLITGPVSGITRDAISISGDWSGTKVKIFDTAGMRRRSKVTAKIEKLSVADGLRAVRFAEVVIVVVDAKIPFESQDLRLADLAAREGRATVVAVNKWDLVASNGPVLEPMRTVFESRLPQLRGAPLVPISAKTGDGIENLHESVLFIRETWSRRIATSLLNEWLKSMVEAHPPPALGGQRIRLRYITQIKTRPPSFVVMCSHPQKLPASYSRYLVNGLREQFDFAGTPIRIIMRSQSDRNPYT